MQWSRIKHLVAGVSLGVLAGSASADLTNHWTFDGHVNDVVGGRVGTVHGTTSFVSGVHGQAFDFDGATYITTDYMPQLSATDPMSIAVWVRLPVGGISGVHDAVGFERSNHQEIRLLINGDSGRIIASFRDDDWVPNKAEAALSLIDDGQWHHLAALRDKGSGEIVIYVDGVERDRQADSGGALNITEPRTMTLAADNNSTFGNINPWVGALDDLRFYDHALTQQEIDDLAGTSSSGPDHYWPLDGHTNDVAGGSTGTVNDGAPAYAPGIRGDAFVFDGTRYVSTDYIPQLGQSDSMTMAAWVRVDSSAHAIHSVVGLERTDHQELKLVLNSDGGNLIASFRDDDWVHSLGIAPASLISDNRWHHIVGIRDADDGKVYLYVDGKRSGCDMDLGTVFNITQPRSMDIGADNNSNRGHIERFIGLVDEVRFYHRALSYDEVLALYQEDMCEADFNGDGAVNTLDVLIYLNAWNAGCP